jgi:hypothetical protein
MIPRRLLPYLALFLALLGLYYGLTWRQARQEAQKTEAKKIFQVKEGEIDALVLKRGQEEVRLVKKDGAWFLTKPVEMRADRNTVESMLTTLAHLQKERDLGQSQDLKAYGLDKPALVVEFTAQDKKPRSLAIGNATPGGMGFYAYQEQAPRDLLLINPGNKASLDRPEKDLRDKTLFAFTPDKVKTVLLKAPETKLVRLEKEGPKSWRWLGRENFPVRGDRVEELVRTLHLAKAKDFVADKPKNLKSYGLAPPQGEIEVVQDKESAKLFLGDKAKEGRYARKAPDGPVVVTDQDLLALAAKALTTLEDRRLWRGEAAKVQRAVWGPPDKTWTGIKEKDFWKITGPGKQEVKQPAVLLEVALWKLQALEFTGAAPPKAPSGKPLYLLELMDAGGKPLFRLEELGREKNQEVLVRIKAGDKTDMGLVPLKAYEGFQKEMARFASPPQGPKAAPGTKTKTEE